MTDRTTYYQNKNTEARRYGGLLRCPACAATLEHNHSLNTYYCDPCRYLWDHNGEPIDIKELS